MAWIELAAAAGAAELAELTIVAPGAHYLEMVTSSCRDSDMTLTCELDDIEPGEVIAPMLLTAVYFAAGEVELCATVNHNSPDLDSSDNSHCASATIRPSAELMIHQELLGAQELYADDEATFRITVFNNEFYSGWGEEYCCQAEDVVITNQLPSSVTATGVVASHAFDCAISSSGQVSCSADYLPPGEYAIDMTVQMPAEGGQGLVASCGVSTPTHLRAPIGLNDCKVEFSATKLSDTTVTLSAYRDPVGYIVDPAGSEPTNSIGTTAEGIYVVTASNAGPSSTGAGTLEIELDDGFADLLVLGAHSSSCSVNETQVICELSQIAAGGSVEIPVYFVSPGENGFTATRAEFSGSSHDNSPSTQKTTHSLYVDETEDIIYADCFQRN